MLTQKWYGSLNVAHSKNQFNNLPLAINMQNRAAIPKWWRLGEINVAKRKEDGQ